MHAKLSEEQVSILTRAGVNLTLQVGSAWRTPGSDGLQGPPPARNDGGPFPAGFAANGDFPSLATAAGTKTVKHRHSPYGQQPAMSQVDMLGGTTVVELLAPPVIDLTEQQPAALDAQQVQVLQQQQQQREMALNLALTGQLDASRWVMSQPVDPAQVEALRQMGVC